MSDEAAEEHEIFDINDFTTASDWERFIVQIEEIINEWKLLSTQTDGEINEINDITKTVWDEKSDTIQFADTSFTITRNYLTKNLSTQLVYQENESIVKDSTILPPRSMADLLSVANDFKGNIPKLAEWYGLNDFLVIRPTRVNDTISTESKARILLSSASVAINNTGCHLPIFIQLSEKNRDMFIGICEGSSLRTHFQVIHFSYIPSQYSNLNGLLEIFKSKMASHLIESSPIVFVSIRYTYLIQDSLLNSLSKIDLESDFNESDSNFKDLLTGSIQDSIDAVYLNCVWPSLSEDMITDSDSYSDLDPLKSNDWHLSFETKEYVELKLTTAFNSFLEQLNRTISVSQIIGRENESEYKSSLERLTNPAIAQKTSSLRNMTQSMALKMKKLNTLPIDLPLSKNFLDALFNHLFPDADGHVENNNIDLTHETNSYKKLFSKLSLLKSSLNDSSNVLNKLAICMLNVCQIGKTKAIAQLWNEFLLELRCRWDSNFFVYGIPANSPDLSRCIFHQKLQLLNCCIAKKIDRDKLNKQTQFENNDNDDDEFFDALEDDDVQQQEPDGRSKQCGDLYLVNNPKIPLYVPITQEPTPMTEDMLEEHASVLVNLGNTDDASLLRAKIQSSSLLSDMESFKAANPGCILEDFLRWYSPRDLIESEIDGIKKYELSARMKIPGNMWIEAWQNAKPVPVRKQKRLFDDTKEAEKIFEWLNSQSIGQIVSNIFPILTHTIIIHLLDEAKPLLDCQDLNLYEKFETLIDKSITATRNIEDSTKYKVSKNLNFICLTNLIKSSLKDLVHSIESIENILARFKLLKTKFAVEDDNLNDFIIECLIASFNQTEVKIKQGPCSDSGKLVIKFVERQAAKNSENTLEKPTSFVEALNSPYKREYIIRSSCPRPAPYSRQSPQRMFCAISNNEFRLAGAFTEDTMFF